MQLQSESLPRTASIATIIFNNDNRRIQQKEKRETVVGKVENWVSFIHRLVSYPDPREFKKSRLDYLDLPPADYYSQGIIDSCIS